MIDSESNALHLARQGDAAALEFLYRRYRQRVYAHCLRMAKNHAQAEDLTQETFLAVIRGIQQFRGQSAFATWLHRVTHNTILMCFRKKRIRETSLEQLKEPDTESASLPAELGTPDLHLESLPDRFMLRNAVARLSAGFRTSLVLHDVHGYDHREVATFLGCTTGTSKSQLHKARLRMREMLTKWSCRKRRWQTIANPPTENLFVPRGSGAKPRRFRE